MNAEPGNRNRSSREPSVWQQTAHDTALERCRNISLDHSIKSCVGAKPVFQASSNSLTVANHPLSSLGVHVIHAATIAACVIEERESPQLLLNSTCSPEMGSSRNGRETHESHHTGSEDKCRDLHHSLRIEVLEQSILGR